VIPLVAAETGRYYFAKLRNDSTFPMPVVALWKPNPGSIRLVLAAWVLVLPTAGASRALTSGDEMLCEAYPKDQLARELQADPECAAARRQHVADVCTTLDRQFITEDILREPGCLEALDRKKKVASAKEGSRLAAIEKLNIPDSTKKILRERKLFVGATAEMARLSWGPPEKINRTYTADIVHEQWVYPSGSYLYFDNGILSVAQIPGRQ
jgi:hypothetical protein